MRLRFLPVLRGYTTCANSELLINWCFPSDRNNNLPHNEKYHQCCLRYSFKLERNLSILYCFSNFKKLKEKKNRRKIRLNERSRTFKGKKLFVGILSQIKKVYEEKCWRELMEFLQILHVFHRDVVSIHERGIGLVKAVTRKVIGCKAKFSIHLQICQLTTPVIRRGYIE